MLNNRVMSVNFTNIRLTLITCLHCDGNDIITPKQDRPGLSPSHNRTGESHVQDRTRVPPPSSEHRREYLVCGMPLAFMQEDFLVFTRVFHDKEIWCTSVRLSDRPIVTHNKIHFVKNCPQWGLNSQPLDNHSNALLTEIGRNMLEISELSFVSFLHHFTCWTLFISRINRAWLCKGLNDSYRQPNSDLAQLVEH